MQMWILETRRIKIKAKQIQLPELRKENQGPKLQECLNLVYKRKACPVRQIFKL